MARHSNQAFLLLITVISTTLAAVLITGQSSANSGRLADNYPGPLDSARVTALAVQLRPGMDGIALIDTANSTICIYQYQAHRPVHDSFVLLAARSFRYDCQLVEYNTAEPRPEQVRQLIQQAQVGSQNGSVTETKPVTTDKK